MKIRTAKRNQYTPFFKFKFTDLNLLTDLVCLWVPANGGFLHYDWSDHLSIKFWRKVSTLSY